MECNEIEAIKFARRLMHLPPSKLHDGRVDAGWCCNEHAVIATLTFTILGIKSQWCTGAVMIGPDHEGNVLDVIPHDFVAIGRAGDGIFDSSITHAEIQGLPVAYASAYPSLDVALYMKKPTRNNFYSQVAQTKKYILALYSIRRHGPPNAATVRWESSTPFGQWLTQRYGSQQGIWAKAAWNMSRHFLMAEDRLDVESSKEDLWDAVVSTPDKDALVIERIELMYGT